MGCPSSEEWKRRLLLNEEGVMNVIEERKGE